MQNHNESIWKICGFGTGVHFSVLTQAVIDYKDSVQTV